MSSKLTALLTIAVVTVGLNVALSRRTEASPPVPLPSPFVGTWKTTWTPHYGGPEVKAPVTVSVDTSDPNALDGVVEVKGPNGMMYGAVSLAGAVWTWKGNWWNNDGTHGSFTFTLSEKTGKSFTGSYKIAGSEKAYGWSGTK